jgi:checkpoint serine/threonine-protein kinase
MQYWQTELWTELFDTLLNSTGARPDGSLPITHEMGLIRAKFERWLEDNCVKGGKNLKSMLRKIEGAAMAGKRV